MLRVRDIPVFYFPYLSFRSATSAIRPAGAVDRHHQPFGPRHAHPYYWNIAPNQDATITPRVLSDRGVMLETEYRYLSETYQGRANVEYLPGDDLVGRDRFAARLTHTQFFFGQRGRLFAS